MDLTRLGYDVNRSCGLIACGGIIALVIPPSIGMILFGVTGGVSITKLFMAVIAAVWDFRARFDKTAEHAAAVLRRLPCSSTMRMPARRLQRTSFASPCT